MSSNHDLPDVDWSDALREPLLASEHPPLQQSASLDPPQDSMQQHDGTQHQVTDPADPEQHSVGADALYSEQGLPYAPPPHAYYEDGDATAAAADAQGAVRDEDFQEEGPRGGVPQILEQDLLEDLRALDDLEGQAAEEQAPPQPEYLDEEDLYRMKELIHEKPRDVIQWIEEEGVIKLGEIEVQDSLALNSFGTQPILTFGDDHLDCDWAKIWLDILSDKGRLQVDKTGWSTNITLEAHAVNIRDAAASGSRGLLQPLLKRYSARGCSMGVFALPAVQAVISFKWATWARRFLMYELLLYIVWLVSFITFSLLFEGEDPDQSIFELMQTSRGVVTVTSSLLCVAAMVPFLYMEMCTIWVYQLGWVNLWNMIDLACYAVQVAITVLYTHRRYINESWFSVLLAVQHILLWSKLHYFARSFSPTKSLLVDTIRVVIDDMKWFLLFLGLTMLGFAFAFYSLFRQDREDRPDFRTLWHSFASMFAFLLAMFDYNVLYESTNPVWAMVMFMIYEFCMNIMLLNIMIAIMTSSFAKVTQDEGVRFLFSKAQIIDELEATLPSWLQRKSWFPPFVHILKVHPSSTYEVNLTSVWSGMGLMENNLLNANQETRLRIEAADERMARINRKLDVMVKMMMGVMGSMKGQGQYAPQGGSGLTSRGYPAFVSRRPAAPGLRSFGSRMRDRSPIHPNASPSMPPSRQPRQPQSHFSQHTLTSSRQRQQQRQQQQLGVDTGQGGAHAATPVRHARSDATLLHTSDQAFDELVQAAADNGMMTGHALDPFAEGARASALPGGGWKGARLKSRSQHYQPPFPPQAPQAPQPLPRLHSSQLTSALQTDASYPSDVPGGDSTSTPGASAFNSPYRMDSSPVRLQEQPSTGSAHAQEGGSNRGFGSLTGWYSLGSEGAAIGGGQNAGALPMQRSGTPVADHAESGPAGAVSPESTPRARLYATPVPRAAQRGAHALSSSSSRRRGAGYGWETQHGHAYAHAPPFERVSADMEGTTDAEERGESHDGASEPSTVEGSHSHGTLVWPRTQPGRFRRDRGTGGYLFVPSSASRDPAIVSPAAVLGRRYSMQQFAGAVAQRQQQQQDQQYHYQPQRAVSHSHSHGQPVHSSPVLFPGGHSGVAAGPHSVHRGGGVPGWESSPGASAGGAGGGRDGVRAHANGVLGNSSGGFGGGGALRQSIARAARGAAPRDIPLVAPHQRQPVHAPQHDQHHQGTSAGSADGGRPRSV